jgi:hypothetical protein
LANTFFFCGAITDPKTFTPYINAIVGLATHDRNLCVGFVTDHPLPLMAFIFVVDNREQHKSANHGQRF